jgi:hypothetical protein
MPTAMLLGDFSWENRERNAKTALSGCGSEAFCFAVPESGSGFGVR